MKKLIASIALVTLIAIGCAPMMPYVPAFPMEKGKAELHVTVGCELGATPIISSQVGGYYAISDRDIVAATFLPELLPAIVSYAHYFPMSSNWGYLQVHKSLEGSISPLIEIDFGYGKGSRYDYNGGRLGIGLYTAPHWDYAQKKETRVHTLGWLVGRQYRKDWFSADGEYIFGYSPWKMRREAEQDRASDTSQGGDFRPRVIPHDSVSSIDTITTDSMSPEYVIHLDSSRMIVIASLSQELHDLSKVLGGGSLSPHHLRKGCSTYGVWEGERRDVDSLSGVVLVSIELNMKKIIEDYKKGGDLRLVEESDLLDRSFGNMLSGMGDLFIQVGGLYYDKK